MSFAITLIIPSLGSKIKLNSLLKSINSQDFSLPVEILICHTPAEVLKTYELVKLKPPFELKIIPVLETGIGKARNQGLCLAQGQVILLIDDDCRFSEKNDLHFIFTTATANPHRIHTGFYRNSKTTTLSSCFYNFMCNTWLLYRENHVIIGGCCFFINSKPRLKFSDSDFDSGEEYEFSQQAHTHGQKIHLLKTWGLLHDPSYSWSTIVSKAWRQGKTLHLMSGRSSVCSKSLVMQLLTHAHFAPLLFFYLLTVRISFFKSRWSTTANALT